MFVHCVYILIATPTLLRKSAVIALELACLSIDICMLSETWLTGTGSIWEGHYTFWSGYPDGSRPRHGSSGFAGRNTLLPCMENLVAVSPRLMTLQLSSGYLAVLSAYALALLPPLRKKMHSTISCPGLSDWSGRATVLTCRWLQCLYWYRLIPPGPVHLVHLEYGTWTKIVNVCLSCALSSISVLQTRILLVPRTPKSHGCTLVLDGGINLITWSWGDRWMKSVTVTACILRTATQIMHWSVVSLPCRLENFIYLAADHLLPWLLCNQRPC